MNEDLKQSVFYDSVGDRYEALRRHSANAPRTDYAEEMQREDNVNHPSHYTWLKDVCGVEAIDICEHLGFNLGNAAKYILRAGHKREEGMTDNEKRVQDLKKAAWYINREINNLTNEE